MRIPFIMLGAAVLVVSSCGLTVRHAGPSHHSGHYYHHEGPGRSHRSHRHWNAAGPAYAEASVLSQIVILPVKLPEAIQGEFSSSDEAGWRRDWPMVAAQLVADGLTKRTAGLVTGTAGQSKVVPGYYMQLEITFLDVGDVRPNADGTPRLRGSSLAAHGVIMNAATGVMVADVKFTESSAWTGLNQFETFASQVGGSLGDWFKERRAAK